MQPKEVKISLQKKDFYLYVFSMIKEGIRPSVICQKLNISKQALNYYLSSLKRNGFIRKVGYGTWEIIKEFNKKQVKNNIAIGSNPLYMTEVKKKEVRGHAFLFKFKIPYRLRNWLKREDYLRKRNIKYQNYYVGGLKRGQQITFKGKIIRLTNKSIIIQVKESYFAKTAKSAKDKVIYDIISIIRQLERYLRADFKIKGKYVFKVSRQHYALIKNALAKQYNRIGQKLHVYDNGNLWLVIDNSYNLDELENLDKDTADIDNRAVQDFFNGVKRYKGAYTPEFIMDSLGNIVNNQASFNNQMVFLKDNLKTHFKVLDNINNSILALKEVLMEMKGGK